MLGHVTSSYHSAALGRPFALALIKNGRNRIGETLHRRRSATSWWTSSSPKPSSTTPKGAAEMAEHACTARLRSDCAAARRPTWPSALAAGAVDRRPRRRLREMPFLTMVGLRVDPGTAAAGRGSRPSLGARCPPACGEVAGAATAPAVLWLGPDEFLRGRPRRTARA